jgi:hypothetical protein
VVRVTGVIIASVVVFCSLGHGCLIHRSGKRPGEGSCDHFALGAGFLFFAILAWLPSLGVSVVRVTGVIIASVVVFCSLGHGCLIHRSGKCPGEGLCDHFAMHRSAHGWTSWIYLDGHLRYGCRGSGKRCLIGCIPCLVSTVLT